MNKKLLSEKVFQNEIDVLREAKAFLKVEKSEGKLKDEYRELCSRYESLLGIARLLTSMSDRLHLRLNKANKKLKSQAEEIQAINDDLHENNERLKESLDQLVKANIGRRAGTIVLVIAVVLFVFSEAYLEPIVESSVDNENMGLVLKGAIALLLKPIDIVVEKYLIRRRLRQHENENR
jgi:hypothetical protein